MIYQKKRIIASELQNKKVGMNENSINLENTYNQTLYLNKG